MEKTIKLQKIKRKRAHGFRKRMRTHAGHGVIRKRKNKKRQRLAA